MGADDIGDLCGKGCWVGDFGAGDDEAFELIMAVIVGVVMVVLVMMGIVMILALSIVVMVVVMYLVASV